MEKQQARADEAKGKQSAWAKFGKKAQKKGIHIAGLEGKSVFKTSDSVTGRGKFAISHIFTRLANELVGVVGSGRGVTQYEKMGKHKFETGGEE